MRRSKRRSTRVVLKPSTNSGSSPRTVSVGPVGHGYIAAGSTYQTVRVELGDLQPDYSYTYWVFAINSAGWAKGSGKEFKAVNPGSTSTGGSPLPPIENTATPFERPVESWIGKSAAEGAARELAKAEAEREAREAANQPPAAVPLPKGEWCGEENVPCEGSEAIKPKPKTVAQLRAEKLVKALKQCKKYRSKTKRAECDKQARQKAPGQTKKGSRA